MPDTPEKSQGHVDQLPTKQDPAYYRYEFWKKLQNSQGTYVPTHIQKILQFNCLDTPASFVTIDDTLLEELEKFARHDMIDLIEEENPNMKDYFGYYWKNHEKFKFLAGERAILKHLVQYAKEQNPQYWSCSAPIEEDAKKQEKQCKEKIDTKTAENNLSRLISKTVDNLAEKLDMDIANLLQKKISVNVKTDANATLYLAKIVCPVCRATDSKYPIINLSKSINGKVQWKMSNFRRHLNRHFISVDNKNREKNSGRCPTQTSTSTSTAETNSTSECTDLDDSLQALPNITRDENRQIQMMQTDAEQSISPIQTNAEEFSMNTRIEPTTSLGQAVSVLANLQDLQENDPVGVTHGLLTSTPKSLSTHPH